VAVRQLRLVVTASDYDEAVRFYRDVLGLPERAAVSAPDRRVAILDAGLATLELAEPAAAEFIDRVEVGVESPGTSGSPWRSMMSRQQSRHKHCSPTQLA
jgi:lactoylglutathione lyase